MLDGLILEDYPEGVGSYDGSRNAKDYEQATVFT